MIHSRGANASDAEVVWSQLLQGIGGGFAAVMAQTGAQVRVLVPWVPYPSLVLSPRLLEWARLLARVVGIVGPSR